MGAGGIIFIIILFLFLVVETFVIVGFVRHTKTFFKAFKWCFMKGDASAESYRKIRR